MKLFYYLFLIPVISALPSFRKIQTSDECGCIVDNGYIDCLIEKPYGPPPKEGTIIGECPDDSDCDPIDVAIDVIVCGDIVYNIKDCYKKDGHVCCELLF